MSKPRIGILRGGPSEEYDVSLKTGSAMLLSIDQSRFDPVDIIITKSGEWLINGVARYPEQILHTCDAVLIALHGSFGEDGSVQRLLERYGVAYNGSGPLASSIALNKQLTKEHLGGTGIKTPRSRKVSQDDISRLHIIVSDIRDQIGSRYVVKPLASGSSLGVELVLDTTDLRDILEHALERYAEVLVEEYIEGREATCAVVERFRGKELYVLPTIEIIPPPGATHFDYDAKYHPATLEVCPSNFSHTVKETIESISRRVHEHLNLKQYSRSDFMVRGDEVFFLEVNTLPGLTNESLIPKALTAVGSSYNEFINHLIVDTLTVRK
jgi:D-alanine-D-alanine ligase